MRTDITTETETTEEAEVREPDTSEQDGPSSPVGEDGGTSITPTEAEAEAPTVDGESFGPKDSSEDEPDTFPRQYVEELRDENAKFRQRAKDRDDLAQRLHVALVAATGRLADPSDLEYSDDTLSDPEALTAALDDLLERKPHLASRTPRGSVGQGAAADSGHVDLAGLLRARA